MFKNHKLQNPESMAVLKNQLLTGQQDAIFPTAKMLSRRSAKK
jgi:hypothetical protein